MESKDKRWLTPVELAREFGFSKSTQAKMRMYKKIPYVKIGGKFIRYDRVEIDRWLEMHKIVGIEL